MEKPQHTVVQVTASWPTGLYPAEKIAEQTGVPVDRIKELALAGYLPHYRIDGGEPLFKVAEAKDWMGANMLQRVHGRALPDVLRVVMPALEIYERPPESIANIKILKQMPKVAIQPGVYFLCKGNQVVYVGQSINPTSRIATHMSDKEFDRAYLLPTPESELDDVEGAFIRLLRPRLNGRHRGEGVPFAPRGKRSDEDVLSEILGHDGALEPQ